MNEKVKLFKISMPDANINYFSARGKELRGSEYFCQACGCPLKDKTWIRPYEDVRRSSKPYAYTTDDAGRYAKSDFCWTNEGIPLVSPAARSFLSEECSTDLQFHPTFKNLFRLIAPDTVRNDFHKKPPYQAEGHCDECGQFRVLLFLGANVMSFSQPLCKSGLYFTHETWGTCPRQHRIIFAGEDLALRLCEQFDEIYVKEFAYF